MNIIVELLKEGYLKQDDSVNMARLTKPAKVPACTKDMTLETYFKWIETQNEFNEDVPPNTVYQDFVENLMLNKDIRRLPQFVGEHVVSVLEKKKNKTVRKVIELLDVKYGRTRI